MASDKGNKNSIGRPERVNDNILLKLEEAFALGCTDLEACYYADISKNALYNYQKKNPEFKERKEKLKERPILMARQSVVSNLKENPELSLKFLERKRKAEFSPRSEVVNLDQDYYEKENEKLKKLEEELLKDDTETDKEE